MRRKWKESTKKKRESKQQLKTINDDSVAMSFCLLTVWCHPVQFNGGYCPKQTRILECLGAFYQQVNWTDLSFQLFNQPASKKSNLSAFLWCLELSSVSRQMFEFCGACRDPVWLPIIATIHHHSMEECRSTTVHLFFFMWFRSAAVLSTARQKRYFSD